MGPSNLPEEERFFDQLRHKLEGDEVQPSAAVWPVISQTLPQPRTGWRQWRVAAAGLLGVVLGILIGWWAGVGTTPAGPYRRPHAPDMTVATTSGRSAAPAARSAGPARTAARSASQPATAGGARPRVAPAVQAGPARVRTRRTTARFGTKPSGVRQAAAPAPLPSPTQPGSTPAVPAPGATVTIPLVPQVSIWSTALAQDSAIRQETARSAAAGGMVPDSPLPALVAAQRETLATLQAQLDSLKSALPMEPPLLAPAPGSARDSVPALTKPLNPWGISLLAEITGPWGTLPGYNPETTTEDLSAPVMQGVHVERRINDRWLVRLGLADTRLHGQFRYTNDRAGQRITTDSSIVTRIDTFMSTRTSIIVHRDSVLRLDPRINASGQVIGYDSLWLPRYDTTFQIVISHDTVKRTEKKVLTRVDTWRETHRQQLRPAYRFWTIPVAAQLDVLRWRRWNAGLGIGAQVVVFRGGEQPVMQGDTYELRRIGPRDGPFRPVSLSLSTALEIRYRLTDRLSLLGGGSVRGWAIHPLRNDSRVQLTQGAHLGMSWGFGGR